MIKLGLRVRGLDLGDPDAWADIPADLADLDWNGTADLLVAYLYSETPERVLAEALLAARAIANTEGLELTGVYDELVGVPDIAMRLDLSPETVRLWVEGRRRASEPFPGPAEIQESSAGRITRLFLWREIVAWSRRVLGQDPDQGIEYLDSLATARLNSAVLGAAQDSSQVADLGTYLRQSVRVWDSARLPSQIDYRFAPVARVADGQDSGRLLVGLAASWHLAFTCDQASEAKQSWPIHEPSHAERMATA